MTKSGLQAMIDELPDEGDIDFDALMEKLYLLAKLDDARREIAEGKGISHEEMGRRLAPWLT